jgi:hypothetical protein
MTRTTVNLVIVNPFGFSVCRHENGLHNYLLETWNNAAHHEYGIAVVLWDQVRGAACSVMAVFVSMSTCQQDFAGYETFR